MRELGIITGKYNKTEFPNNLGKRSKLGGTPEWIQNEEEIICRECNQQMSFVCQLDSIDYTGEVNNNEEYMFGDVGMIYTFFCFDCSTVKSVVQGS